MSPRCTITHLPLGSWHVWCPVCLTIALVPTRALARHIAATHPQRCPSQPTPA